MSSAGIHTFQCWFTWYFTLFSSVILILCDINSSVTSWFFMLNPSCLMYSISVVLYIVDYKKLQQGKNITTCCSFKCLIFFSSEINENTILKKYCSVDVLMKTLTILLVVLLLRHKAWKPSHQLWWCSEIMWLWWVNPPNTDTVRARQEANQPKRWCKRSIFNRGYIWLEPVLQRGSSQASSVI